MAESGEARAARSRRLRAKATLLIAENQQEADIARLQLKVICLRLNFFDQSITEMERILLGTRLFGHS